MENLDNSRKVFFELLKGGLWGDGKPDVRIDGTTVWQDVYRLATEQSVLGLVRAGLERSEVKPPKVLLLQWIGEVQQIEQRNKAMNIFIADLIDRLRYADINALLVKGQGIAQCYEKPLWRSSGDVDLLLSNDNYDKAKAFLMPLASEVEKENQGSKHLGMTIDGWVVELHGSLRGGLWKKLDIGIDEIQKTVFCEGQVRSWLCGETQVFIPREDEDIVFVFTHLLQHFFREGVGLRQICDWCRLLWTYKDSLNHKLLESRIKSMGVMTEWEAFAALAVDFLGMPVEAMPFYLDDKKWKRKAVRVMEFVLETGNFGHNRDYSYRKKYPYIIYKAISFWRHLKDGALFFSIFPLDSIKVTWRRMVVGASVVLQGKKHE